MMLKQPKTTWSTTGSIAMLMLLAACGGGGGGDSNGAPASPTISGVAAASAALADRPVAAQCASGSASATTGADGAYQMPLGSATFPCLLQVTAADGSTLYSVAVGSGAVTAHITPVTDLVVASLGGKVPATQFASFDATAAASATAGNVATAASAVAATLADAGLPAVASPVTTSHDAALAALADAMTSSGTTLAQLEAAVATASTVSPPVVGDTPSLPAAQLLKRPAANCAALRSGVYRIVVPYYSDLASQTGKVTIDAAALTFTETDGSVDTWVANGPCRFLGNNAQVNKTDIVVSPAGVLAARFFGDDGKYHLAIAFPEQTHAVAELAGDWNNLATNLTSGSSAATAQYAGTSASGSIASDGTLSNIAFCADIVNCAPVSESMSLRIDAAGGLDLVNTTANWTDRYFAYRTGGGELMMIGFGGDGSLSFWTKRRTNGLSAAGDKSKTWGLWTNTANVSTAAVSENAFTTLSNDAAAGSWLRQDDNNGHLETLVANNPRNGYTHRAAGSATASNGAPVTVNEFTALGLRGMGLSVLWLPGIGLSQAPGALFLSVQQP